MAPSKRKATTPAARSSSRQSRRKVVFEPEPQGPSRRQDPSHRSIPRPPPARRTSTPPASRRSPRSRRPPAFSIDSLPRGSSDVTDLETEFIDEIHP